MDSIVLRQAVMAGTAVLVAGLAIIAMILLVTPAASHGWYEPECCSGRDCAPVAIDEVEELPGGAWRHLPSGLVFGRELVRPSRDRHFHVCIHPISRRPLCIYVLQGS